MTINFVVKCLQGVSTCSFSDLLASCDSAGEVEAFVHEQEGQEIDQGVSLGRNLFVQPGFVTLRKSWHLQIPSLERHEILDLGS